MGANGQLSYRVTLREDDDRYDLADSIDPVTLAETYAYANGIEPDQITLGWHDRYAITSTPQRIDLRHVEDFAGNRVVFSQVRVLCFRISGTADVGQEVRVAPSASGSSWVYFLGAGSTLKLQGPGVALFASQSQDGWLTPAGASAIDVQTLTGSVTFDIIVLGIGS